MTAKIVSPRPEGLGIIMVKFVKLIWQLATGAGAAVVATTVVGANPAQAVLLTYDLQGTLIDGGSFVGTFSYDTEEPDLAPGEEFALFLLETWNIQVSSPSLGDFQWSGDVSTDDPDAALFQFLDEGDEFVGFGFGIVDENASELEEVFAFGVGFEYLGSDLNLPTLPEEIGDFQRGLLFNDVEVSTAQIRQVSVPESSSPLGLLAIGFLSAGATFLRQTNIRSTNRKET